jgi:hypothetical protein
MARSSPRRRVPARRRRTRRTALVAIALGAAPAVLLGVLAACLPAARGPSEPAEVPAATWPGPALAATAVAGADPATTPAIDLVDPDWADSVAGTTGIPRRALVAYAAADLTLADERPGCGITWNTLAGIGRVESAHGAVNGGALREDGAVEPRILGPRLDGDGVAAIPDTDGGAWDGDTRWDRAIGPMQFIPETWARWGADGDADGVRDPNHIDDAALAAGRYLCRTGPLDTEDAWRDAVFTYNPLTRYVDAVAAAADEYARAART